METNKIMGNDIKQGCKDFPKKTLNKFETQMENIRLALNSPTFSSENLMVHKDIIILLAKRTLGAMPSEFAKQEAGLR